MIKTSSRLLGKFCLAASVLVFTASSLKAQLNAYFVNVGQGDAIYLEFPNGTNALIDGGPRGEPIYQFLKIKGVTKLDRVLLTHPHSDHYRGLKKVFNSFEVDKYYDTRAENVDAVGDNNLRELAAAEPGCRTLYPEPGSELKWDSNVTVKVLNSCTEKVQIHDNDENNNCSLVIRLYYNGTGILLTGDAEGTVEDAMMRIYKSGLNSTYLKVSHHGSRFSSTAKFLARVQPRIAIISAGANNVYGHPHKEALDRLVASGAQIYTTLGGTQSLTIPAPKKGVELMVNGELDLAPASLTEIPKFNMEQRPFETADAYALQQLKESEAK
jgi:competence protein ComEC